MQIQEEELRRRRPMVDFGSIDKRRKLKVNAAKSKEYEIFKKWNGG